MKRYLIMLSLALLLLSAFAGCSAGSSGQRDVPLEEILQNIRDAYGEDYLPNMEMSAEVLETQYGLNTDLYAEALGETPMIGAHPDVVLIVRAESGKAEQVQAVLEQVRERKISEELQYPMNLAKVDAAQVVRSGDYVAFLLVGAVDDVSQDEEAAAAFAREQVKKAVDAFQGSLA